MGGEVIIEKNPSEKFCVSEKELLCDSIIWEMLQNYYKNAAINAWKENIVPSFVTSNSKIAKDYARVIVNYMKDWFNSNECDRSVPIYILEVGAGHGKFTYLILRALSKYVKYFQSMNIPNNAFVYVFTDVARDNIEYCMNHVNLKKYINKGINSERDHIHFEDSDDEYFNDLEEKTQEQPNGTTNSGLNTNVASSSDPKNVEKNKQKKKESNFSMLDFAFFDGNDTSDQIYLEIAKKNIPPNTPIVLICNYVLDSLLTDAWIVNGQKECKRALISVYSPVEEKEKTHQDIMLRMSVTWDWQKVNLEEEIKKEPTEKPSDYLRRDKDMYSVLKVYSYFNQYLTFVYPVGAFILFKRILKLSNNKLLCLIGDKGYQSYEEFIGYRNPHIVIHGSLSFMVNLNAICFFFLSLGGYYIYTPYADNFQLVALLLHKKKESPGQEKGKETSSLDITQFFEDHVKSFFMKKSSEKPITNTEMNPSEECAFIDGAKRAQMVYKKLKKINMKNLNDMSIKFGGTVSAFYDNMEQMPPDLLITLQKMVMRNMNHHGMHLKFKELLSLLRYSNYDADVLLNMRMSFLKLACFPNINGRTEKDILLDIKECYNNHYSLRDEEDIADFCGQLCMKFGEFEKSIYYLKESLRKFKKTRHSSTYINIASCYKVLRNYSKSLKFFTSAIKLYEKEKYRAKKEGLVRNPFSFDLLYSIQFCANPVTFVLIGVNFYFYNDGIYYLSFESRFKLTQVFLLSEGEEETLKQIVHIVQNSSCDRTKNKFEWDTMNIVRVYKNNEVVPFAELMKKEINNEIKESKDMQLNEEKKKINYEYPTEEEIQKNLEECVKKYPFQFAVIDAPWGLKAMIVNVMIDHNKHIYTYGTLTDCTDISIKTINNYKTKAKELAWLNNNYVHDDCIYEARQALRFIQTPYSINIIHHCKHCYTNTNQAIPNEDPMMEELCILLNMLYHILRMRLSGVSASVLRKEKENNTSEKNSNENMEETNVNDLLVSLSGLFLYSIECKDYNNGYYEIHGNYLLMNSQSDEFMTSINIVGKQGYMSIKRTVTSWNIIVFNNENEKVFENSGRIGTSQNASDVFLNQYLVKTNGVTNGIKHYKEYLNTSKTETESQEAYDSDRDILYISDDEGIDSNGKREDSSPEVLTDNREINIIDPNIMILKQIEGYKFYSTNKDIYENMKLDPSFVDVTVNFNNFYARFLEGIKLSNEKNGQLIYFKY